MGNETLKKYQLAFWVGFALLVARVGLCLPVIQQQPQSQLVKAGATVTLSVTASGFGQLQFQWRKNGVIIPGATRNQLIISDIQPFQSGNYSVTIRDILGITNSEPAQIIVDAPILPFTDEFNGDRNSIPFSPGLQSGRGNNSRATRQPGEPNHAGKRSGRSVWLSWRPLSQGIAIFDTSGSGFDTVLAVYSGSDLSDLAPIAGNDDRGGSLNSRVIFNAEAMVEYHIAVAGLAGANGHIILNWNFEGTTEKLPRILTAPVNLTGIRGETLDLVVTFTSDVATSIGWLLNDQALVNATQERFTLDNLEKLKVGRYVARIRAGTREILTEPVNIQIHVRADGIVVRNVTTDDKFGEAFAAGERPQKASLNLSNPGRSSAAPASGFRGTQIFTTVGSSSEEGEPNHCGLIAEASEWYSYQPPASGILTIDTDGSDFDTVLAVYTSASPSPNFEDLQLVACDRNSGADGQDSKVIFQAAAQTIYSIAVDTESGATGNATLNYTLTRISAISAQSTAEDTPTAAIAFTVGDDEAFANSLAFLATSGNTNLVPSANMALGGSGTNRTLTITPAANLSGTSLITVTARSGSAATSASFMLSVNPVNDAPIADSQSISVFEDEPRSLTLTGSDLEGDPLTFIMVGNPNKGSLAGAPPSLTYTPHPNVNGADSFTFTVNDGTADSQPATVSINITSVNDPPSISAISDQSMNANDPALTIGFVVADLDTPLESLLLSASSTNSILLPIEGITISGAGPNRTLTLNAAPDQFGTTMVTITVSDGMDSAHEAFVLTISALKPGILAQPQGQTVGAGASLSFSVQASGSNPLNYQWLFNGSPIAGATAASLTLTNVSLAHAGNYNVEVTNAAGSIFSSLASLAVAPQAKLAGSFVNGQFEIRLSFAPGIYILQATSDWQDWISLTTNNSPDGLWQFLDPDAPVHSLRFYRAVHQP